MKDEPVEAKSVTGRGSSAPKPAAGVETGDGPDDNVLQAVYETFFNDRVDKALVIEARRAYATYHNTSVAKVTMTTLENSWHGLRGWIKWANAEVSFDAPEDQLPCVSKQECAARIRGVLADRRTWLAEKNLPHDVIPGLLMEPHGGVGAGAIPHSTVDGSRGAEEAQQRSLHQTGA